MAEILSERMREKYHMAAFDDFVERHGEADYYETFLIQTDYICNKITEALYTGTDIGEDYTEELTMRKKCRERISALRREADD